MVAIYFCTCNSAVVNDAVGNLPGFGTPLSKMYSGYLNGGTGKKAHYIYTESLLKPATDPLVLWFNGGPGCSSMEGFLSESGLYHIDEFSNPPTISANPFSWGKVSNNLFIESPAGVGFSYCETPAGCRHTDTSTANDNLAALVSFFTSYPELQDLDFYIAGESYAGVYIPSLAYAIYNYNTANPAPALQINLKGIMVGNGCIGNAAGHCGSGGAINAYHDIQQWRGHGLISETTYDHVNSVCDWKTVTPKCELAVSQAVSELGMIDVYYLYNTCADPAMQLRNVRAPISNMSALSKYAALKAKADPVKTFNDLRKNKAVGLDPNCFGTGPTLQQWGNLPAVKKALNVAPAITWSLCSSNGSFAYNSDIADERTTIYPTLTQKAGYQVLIYNGEADLCVPFTDNEWWTRSMNYDVKEPWAQWLVAGEEGSYVGGYRIQYDYNFTFATVRGAGHMVPETRPEASFTLFRDFLSKKLFY